MAINHLTTVLVGGYWDHPGLSSHLEPFHDRNDSHGAPHGETLEKDNHEVRDTEAGKEGV